MGRNKWKKERRGRGGSGGRAGQEAPRPLLAGETPAGPPRPPPAAPPARRDRPGPGEQPRRGTAAAPRLLVWKAAPGRGRATAGPAAPKGRGHSQGSLGSAALPELLRGFCRSRNSGGIQREPYLSGLLALGRYRTFKTASLFSPDHGYKNHEGEMRGMYSHFRGFRDWDWVCAGEDTKPSHRASLNSARIKSLQ